jgi:hypothetical protein
MTTTAPASTTANVQNTVNTSINETKEEQIARLKREKDDAVIAEDYEKAAQLRDEIDWLEGTTEEPTQKLFDAYEQRKTKTQGKTFKSPDVSFWMYLKKQNPDANNEYPYNGVMAVFSQLEDKKNIEDVKKIIQEEKDKKNKTQSQNLQDEKDSEIERLNAALKDSKEQNEWLSKSKDQMKKWFSVLRQKGKEEIEKIRNSEWTEREKIVAELKKTQEEKKKLEEENTKLKNTVFGDAKYEENITEEDLKKIRSMIYNRGRIDKDKRWRKTLVAYEKIPLVMVRRRMTIKTIAKALNNIKDDAITGVDFIMAFKKTRFARYDRMDMNMTRRNLLRKAGAGRNLEKFWERFHKKKEMIMEIITWWAKIEELPEEERNVLKAIEQRMDFYGKKYLQDIYQGKSKKQ